MPMGDAHLGARALVGAATSSAMSCTRIVSSIESAFITSSICVMQKRHPTACVFAIRFGQSIEAHVEADMVDARTLTLLLPEASAARAAAEYSVLARISSLQDSVLPLRVTSSTISITSSVWTFSSRSLALMPSPSIVIQ
jgi:hypothetical protein